MVKTKPKKKPLPKDIGDLADLLERRMRDVGVVTAPRPWAVVVRGHLVGFVEARSRDEALSRAIRRLSRDFYAPTSIDVDAMPSTLTTTHVGRA